MKRTLILLFAVLLLSGCAWLGMVEPTPEGGILTTTDTSEVYVGPKGSAWTYELRYVLDDDGATPDGVWTAENASDARVRITIPKQNPKPE
ncbi:MAG: lipoprotein [Sphaerochaeta sp.]|jgi:uncharacterized protein YceK|nr:lipoprotein [Sphaerochaeta sp.]